MRQDSSRDLLRGRYCEACDRKDKLIAARDQWIEEQRHEIEQLKHDLKLALDALETD